MVVHGHHLLLIWGRDLGVDDWEELDSCKFRGEAFSVHKSLDHAHDYRLKVSDLNCRQNLLDALCSLHFTEKWN